MNKTKPAVFIDRDGTLIVEIGYIKNIEDYKLIKGAELAVKKLNDNDIFAILVTNQAGVARGYFDENNVHTINQVLKDDLKKKGAYLDGIYYCPHHPEGIIPKYAKICGCRKPAIGLIQQAVKDFDNIDLAKSYVIGDKLIDVELGKNAGCKGILVKTGYGSQIVEIKEKNKIMPDYIANTIEDAVNWVIKDLNL